MATPHGLGRTEKRKGIIYVRVSSDDQINGTSLDDQTERSTRALTERGVHLDRVFRDEGESAKSADRRALMEALEYCLDPKNGISVFMVWKVDRFARRTEDHFAIRKMLQDAGVELWSATEPIGNDPNAKLFEVLVAGFAEFDNEVRRIRAINGMRARIRSGIWPFKAPLGYRVRGLRRVGLKKTDPDPVDPIIFPLLQRVLKGYAYGVYTQTEMIGELVQADFQTLTGTKPSIQFIDHLLSEQLHFYAGWLRDTLGPVVEFHRGRHEPMITDAEMAAIQARRKGGARHGIARCLVNPRFPLRGLVTCGVCKHALTASSPAGRNRRYHYYHCFNRACPLRYKNIRKADLEAEFLELMATLRPEPRLLSVLTQSVELLRSEQIKLANDRAREHERASREISARRTRIFEMAEAGAYTATEARERLNVLDQELAQLKIATEEAQVDGAVASIAGEAAAVLSEVMAGWTDLDPAARQRFQKILFPEGIPYENGERFGTAKTAMIVELTRPSERSHSEAVRLVRIHWKQVVQELRTLHAIGALSRGDNPTVFGRVGALTPPTPSRDTPSDDRL